MVRSMRNRIEPTKKQLISMMSPNLPKKLSKLLMHVSLGFPLFTSVNRKYKLYCGSTQHQPEQLKTDSKNIIVAVDWQVSLFQLAQFSALTVRLKFVSVWLMNPIFLRLSLSVSLQSLILSKQHQQVFPNVSLALTTAILMELTVVSESSHSVLRQVGYLIMKAARMMKTMKQRSMVTEQTMTNLFFFLMSPQMPDRLERIIMSEVTMNVAMKPFLKSGRICAVTEEMRNAQTRTQRRTIPNSRVTTIPADISVFRQYTDRNIIYNNPSPPIFTHSCLISPTPHTLLTLSGTESRKTNWRKFQVQSEANLSRDCNLRPGRRNGWNG